MKKSVCVCLTVFAVALLVVSCKGSPDAQKQDPNSPEWLNDFPPEGVIWGIGSAKQSSEQMSMTTAEARARTSVARQLSIKVDAMFTDYLRDAGTVDSQTALSLQEDVSRQVTSIQLNGAQPIKRWKAPDSSWWYLVEYKVSDAKTALTPLFTSEESKYAEFKAQEALRMLDTQLSKNEKPVPVFE
ncbi:LPP20 family lipoprotein [Treponema primitia]|uniref:LPP20 family lipoprotein n=1 Tax=Treponema primitia TaxID=88058 RepID=UPI0002554C72|nr:LPP20 family lipoprotein [Treponema primitia]